MSSTIAGELVYKIVGDTSKFDTALKDSHNIVNQFVRSRTLVQLGNQLSGVGREFDKLKTGSKSALAQMTIATDTWIQNHVTALNQGVSANSDYIDSVNSIGDTWGSAVAQGDGFFTMLTQTSGLLSEMRGEVHTLKEEMEGLSTVQVPSGGGGVAQPVVQNDPVVDVLGMTASGVSIGAAFGGPVGAAIGGGLGLVVGGLKELYDYSKDQTPINYAEELSDSYSNLRDTGSKYKDVVTKLASGTETLTGVQKDQLEMQQKLYESQMRREMKDASMAYDKIKGDVASSQEGVRLVDELIVLASNRVNFTPDLSNIESIQAANDELGLLITSYQSLINIGDSLGLYNPFLELEEELNRLSKDEQLEYDNLINLLGGYSAQIGSFSDKEFSLLRDSLSAMGAELGLFYHDTFSDLETYAAGVAESIVFGGMDEQAAFGFEIDTDWEREVDRWVQKLMDKLLQEQTKLKVMPLDLTNDIARRSAQEIIDLPRQLPDTVKNNIIDNADELTLLWIQALEGDANAIREVYAKVLNPPEVEVGSSVSKLEQSYLDSTKSVKDAIKELGLSEQALLDLRRKRALEGVSDEGEIKSINENFDAQQELLTKQGDQQKATTLASMMEGYDDQLKKITQSESKYIDTLRNRAKTAAAANGASEDQLAIIDQIYDKQQEELKERDRAALMSSIDSFTSRNDNRTKEQKLEDEKGSLLANLEIAKDKGILDEDEAKAQMIRVEESYNQMLQDIEDSKKPSWEDWTKEALNSFTQIAGEVDKLIQAITQSKVAALESQMQAELDAMGLVEKQERNKHTKSREEKAQNLVEIQKNLEKETDLQKRNELMQQENKEKEALDELIIEEEKEEDRLAIQEKYEKQMAQVKYKAALFSWGVQMTQAVVGTAQAVINAMACSPFMWGMTIPLAAITGAVQIATIAMSKPEPPAFALGALEIPQDMQATIHQGEMILPRPFAEDVRQGNIAIGETGGGVGGSHVKVEIYANDSVETEEVQDGDMTKLKVFVGKAWLDAYKKGQFDNPLMSRHGIKKRGIR